MSNLRVYYGIEKTNKIKRPMKIYISGKISGLELSDVQTKFADAEAFLNELGFEAVNPMKNRLTAQHTWEQHMVRDIEMLFSCEAIYMMDNWVDSVGAGIEYDIALRTGKDVWFESNIVSPEKIVLRIQNAVHEATGMKFTEYTTKSRKRDGFFARMIFVHHCHANGIDPMKYILRDRTMIYHYLNQYHDETRYNPNFRVLAEKVESILDKTINGKA